MQCRQSLQQRNAAKPCFKSVTAAAGCQLFRRLSEQGSLCRYFLRAFCKRYSTRAGFVAAKLLERRDMSCSGVGQNPYQFLQASSGKQAANSASATDDTAATDAAATAQLQQQLQLQTQGQSGAHHRHHGGGNHAGDGDAISTLLSTIEQALQSANSSDDPNKVIQDTITKLLSGTTESDGSDGSKSAGIAATAATIADAKQSFADVLKAHGVDFQQFRADLMAAVKNAQNGQINPGTALKSFAPGSSVDLTA
jgi:hypothetical protein